MKEMCLVFSSSMPRPSECSIVHRRSLVENVLPQMQKYSFNICNVSPKIWTSSFSLLLLIWFQIFSITGRCLHGTRDQLRASQFPEDISWKFPIEFLRIRVCVDSYAALSIASEKKVTIIKGNTKCWRRQWYSCFMDAKLLIKYLHNKIQAAWIHFFRMQFSSNILSILLGIEEINTLDLIRIPAQWLAPLSRNEFKSKCLALI